MLVCCPMLDSLGFDMQYDYFQEKMTFAPTHGGGGGEGCLHIALCSIPFNLICNMTTFRIKMF